MKYKAVIFDMDGVLIDSEKYWAGVEKRFFETHGVPFTKEIAHTIMGGSDRDLIIWAKEKYGWKESPEVLQEERDRLSEKIYTHFCEPLPGVEKLIKFLRNKQIKIALASCTVLRRIKIIMERFNWKNYFNIVVSAEQIDAPAKPHPAIYNYTARILKLEPDQCVALEDSLNGVKAAKAAGMTCVAVPDSRWSQGDFYIADVIVSSLVDKKLIDFLE